MKAGVKKKTYNLDGDMIEKVRRLFNAKTELPALLNDILIALCARRIGATLLTYNRDNFRLIRRHADFS